MKQNKSDDIKMKQNNGDDIKTKQSNSDDIKMCFNSKRPSCFRDNLQRNHDTTETYLFAVKFCE